MLKLVKTFVLISLIGFSFEAVATEKSVTRDVQIFLTARGYDPGPIDGKTGKSTRTAILAYQKQSGLKPTGISSSKLVYLLMSSDPPADFVTKKFATADGCEVTVKISDTRGLAKEEYCSTETGWNPIGPGGVLQFPGGIPIR